MPAPPTLTYDVLDRPGPQDRLLVLLHGYGEPASDLTDRLHLLDPDGRHRVVVPEAPFERKGRLIWHRALTAPDEYEQQFRASLAALDALIGDVASELGLPVAEVAVGGFSQGGGLALGLLLAADVRHRPALGFGVCSFAPYLRGFRVDRSAAHGRPFFLTSAVQDHFAPIEQSRAGAVVLRQAGLDLTYAETPGGHVMTDEAAAQIGRWLTDHHQGRSPRSEDQPGNELLAGVDPSPAYGRLWEHVT